MTTVVEPAGLAQPAATVSQAAAAPVARDASWRLLWLGLIVLLATALRLYRIDTVSVRGDEAFTIFFSVMPLQEIMAVLRSGEPHPPGFFLTFRFWEYLTGPSPFVARYFSALASIAVVPLAFQFARLVAVERPLATGGLAALLVALSPDLLWHAQDARMYSLMAALMLVVFIATLKYLRTRERRWLVVYAATALYAVLVHYYLSIGLLAVSIAFVAGVFLDRQRRDRGDIQRALVGWGAAQLAVLAVLAPWFYFARNLLGGFQPGWTAPTPIDEMVRRTAQVAVLGTSVDPDLASRLSWLMLALTAAGLILIAVRSRQTGVFVLSLVVVPILIVAGLSIRTPIYLERYLVYLTPLVLVSIAATVVAIAGRRRLLGAALGIAVVVPIGIAMNSYYFDVRFAKAPEWREAALTLQREGRRGDVLVENFPDPAFSIHYRGAGGDLPFQLVPPAGEFDPAEVRASLQRLLAEHERVWLLPVQADNWDKDGLVERYLNAFALPDAEFRYRDVRLLRYRSALGEGTPPRATFDGGLAVRSIDVSTIPGRGVRLTAVLATGARLPYRLKTFVHVIGPDGRLLGQQDVETGSGALPSDAWTGGETLVERSEITLPADAPAGSTVRLGFYDPGSGQRLRLGAGEGDFVEAPISPR